MRRAALATVLIAASVLRQAPLAAQAEGGAPGPQALLAQYQQLLRWRYRAQPAAVPAGGLIYELEGARWTLDTGRLWLGEPALEGAVSGLAFEGKGRFQLEVPDALELAQLRRFARRPQLAALDLTFTACVVRFSGALPFLAAPPADPAPAYAPLKLAVERQEHWLTDRGFDIDARVVAARATPGDLYLRIEMKTDDFG